MRLIPVLDLKGGVVVRGVGGRRDEYRPVESVIARSADPVEVATSLRNGFGFREFYIADLDAIAGGPPHWQVLRELIERDLRLLVDVGLRDLSVGRMLLDAGAGRVIAALETSPGPEQVHSLLKGIGSDRLTFSLDLKAGALLTVGGGWLTQSRDLPSPLEVAECVIAAGVQSVILLDLAGVGEGRGVPTLELCRAVREISPEVEIVTGGGVRNAADLASLEEAGADGVLVASALHNGSLSPADCAQWSGT